MGTVSMKMLLRLLVRTITLLLTLPQALGQAAGDQKANENLKFPIEVCQSEGNCQKISTAVTLDANWRWIHNADGSNCYSGNIWDSASCPDSATCTANCVIEGTTLEDWPSTYGVTGDGQGGVTLKFVTVGQYSTNIGSRMFLLDESGNNYYMFKLKNKEFTMDVDTSDLPCGLNGAVYFVEMDADGGLSYPKNQAGATYGTGYCDAQCPHDLSGTMGRLPVMDGYLLIMTQILAKDPGDHVATSSTSGRQTPRGPSSPTIPVTQRLSGTTDARD